MRTCLVIFAAALARSTWSFVPPVSVQQRSPTLRMSPDQMTPEQLKMSADMFKNIDKTQLEIMLNQLENMGPGEREQYEKMGVNVDMLKMSMKALKNNPRVLEMARKQMANMSPDQLAQASKVAREQFQSVTPTQFEQMATEAAQAYDNVAGPDSAGTIDTTATAAVVDGEARDPSLIDAMFATAQYCANPPSGGVDLATCVHRIRRPR